MNSFNVTEVIDGDTFRVNPSWNWKNDTGDIVRPNGYNTPENGQPGYEEAKQKLTNLILGKDVQLGTAYKITYGRLLCNVHYAGNELKEYFSEY